VECAIWVQTITSIVLVLVTASYVCLTKRLVEESNTAFVDFCNFGINDKDYEVVLKNYGPGVAIGVQVYVKLNSLERSLEGKEDISIMIQATGPTVIPVNSEASFTVSRSKYNRGEGITPVFIKYKTISGKRFIYEWEYDHLNEPYRRLVKQHKKLNHWE